MLMKSKGVSVREPFGQVLGCLGYETAQAADGTAFAAEVVQFEIVAASLPRHMAA